MLKLSQDHIRAWVDQRTVGRVGDDPSFHLQKALIFECLSDDDDNDALSRLDNYLLELCSNISDSEICSGSSMLIDEKDDVIILEGLEKCLEGSLQNRPLCRTLAGLELARDLYISSNYEKSVENFSNKCSQQPAAVVAELQEVKRHKAASAVLPTVANKVEQIELDTSVSGQPAKKSAFRTGKEQFLLEGGKLPTPAATSTSSSGGMSSLIKKAAGGKSDDSPLPEELKNCDKALVEKIEAEIVVRGQPVTFGDIAGLEFAKKCVNELICWPMTRPDLFQGLRSLPKGLLLFGPPGTGKTLIGKAIAHQAGATFFCISASSLTSKWIGEGEKTVRTLFAVAAYRQPSVVFIDEVDSLLCQRSSDENEASRRIKTEFLVQLDGAGTDQTARVVIVGATNRPEELDEAARRRFVKRIYIPLPDEAGRRQLLITLLRGSHHELDQTDLESLVERAAGFSGADVRALCTEAAMGPVREVAMQQGNLHKIDASDVPPIVRRHFDDAFECVMPSVSPSDLQRYIEWNSTFGSFRRME